MIRTPKNQPFQTFTHPQQQQSGYRPQGGGSAKSTRMLMQRMEALDGAPASHQETLSGSIRWMVPYADIITILLGLFLVLYSMQSMDLNKAQKVGGTSKSAPSVALQQEQAALIEDQKEHIALLESELSSTKSLPTTTSKTDGINFLVAELDQDLANIPNVTVELQERGVVISLKEKILFSPGDATLTPSAKTALNQIVKTLKPLSQPIRVEGHTDNTPIQTSRFPSNWELSTARATGIVKYLVMQHKMDSNRLSAAGYGEFKPIADNSTIEGKQKNRRVDIVILNGPASEQEPDNKVTRSNRKSPAGAEIPYPDITAEALPLPEPSDAVVNTTGTLPQKHQRGG